MSLFNAVRKLFGGGGGVDVALITPQTFTWRDDSIPVTLTFTGHASESRTIESLRFTLEEPNQDSERHTFSYPWESVQTIEVPAGSQTTVDVEIPLPFDLDAIDEALPTGPGTPMAERFLGSLVRSAARPPEHISRYRLKVNAKVQGAKLSASHSTNIRYG